MMTFKQFLLEFDKEFIVKMIKKSVDAGGKFAIKIAPEDFPLVQYDLPNDSSMQAKGFINKVWVGSLEGLFVEYRKNFDDDFDKNNPIIHIHRSLIPNLKVKTIDGVKTLILTKDENI